MSPDIFSEILLDLLVLKCYSNYIFQKPTRKE